MRKFLIALGLAACGLTAAGFYITRDIAATHPVLRESALPPLIPTRAFYADPRSVYGFVASSDGTMVAATKASLLGRSIVVRNVASGEQISEFPLGLRDIRWHPTKPLLRFLFEGEDWEADPHAPEPENWTRTSPVRLSGGWRKTQVATDPDMPILTWGKLDPRAAAHMWLVSQDGLTSDLIAEGTPDTKYWVFDKTPAPVLRVDSLDPATERVLRKSADGWEPLNDVGLEDGFYPLSNLRDDNTILTRSARGRDKAALVSFDITTGQETVQAGNPDTDFGWVRGLTFGPEPDLLRRDSTTLGHIALTDRGQVFLDILAEFPQPVTLGDTMPTASGRYLTQAISPKGKSFINLLIDLEDKSYIILDEFHFRRFSDRLVQNKAVTFTARDGLEIPAILTRPPGVTGPIPFIVHIHGGPSGHIGVGYQHDVQFLANRGYGVLSVNFRGSTGFGKAFQARGFKEFGRAMQDDITDAAHWLVAEGMADPDALVAMGASYGGYSAALAMTRDPGLFAAAIVEFPMLDVEFQSKHHPGFWESGIDGWWRYFGKTDNPDDLDLMRTYSPSNRIDLIHGPILLLGGTRDPVTSVQQVRDFEAAALAAGKDVNAQYFPDAGHGVQHWRDRLRRARLIEDYLAEQVGGRSGGFEFVEHAPGFID